MSRPSRAATCRECGCTDDDCSGCVERTGVPCSWIEADLCSACADAIIGAVLPSAVAPLYKPESDQLAPILEWVAAFDCQANEQLVNRKPCGAESLVLCSPCAAAVLLGRGKERFADQLRDHRRTMRAVRRLRRAGAAS